MQFSRIGEFFARNSAFNAVRRRSIESDALWLMVRCHPHRQICAHSGWNGKPDQGGQNGTSRRPGCQASSSTPSGARPRRPPTTTSSGTTRVVSSSRIDQQPRIERQPLVPQATWSFPRQSGALQRIYMHRGQAEERNIPRLAAAGSSAPIAPLSLSAAAPPASGEFNFQPPPASISTCAE